VLGKEEPANEQLTVPDVTNQVLADAQRTLNEQGFLTAVEEVPCQPAADGQPGPCGPDSIGKVIDTNPKPGSKMNKTDKLTLRVGASPEKAQVPDLTGKTLDEAKRLLQPLGLQVAPETPTEEVDDENLVDKVVGQDPAPLTSAAKGTQVKLTLGKAAETVSVPNLTGQTFDTAKTNLEGLGFKVVRTDVSSQEDAGKVVDQDPKTGKHKKGTTVTLSVSNGDQQNPTITMPDLEGRSLAQAETELRSRGWSGSLEDCEVLAQNQGQVNDIVAQTPAPGSQIENNATVRVQVAQLTPDPSKSCS
jgi:beta-lactam-binding protein with PASTA domain